MENIVEHVAAEEPDTSGDTSELVGIITELNAKAQKLNVHMQLYTYYVYIAPVS